MQKTTDVFSESKLITRFQTLRFPANKCRRTELENWKKKNCPNYTTEGSTTESRSLLQRCFLEVSGRLNWIVKPLLFLISRWRFFAILGFCKICLTKGRRNYCGVSLLWIVHRKSSQEQNNKRRLKVGLEVTELSNVKSIRFPTCYGTIHVCSHSWFCRICFDRARAHLFVSATNFCELWWPWRMNTARALQLWTRFFQLGSIYCMLFIAYSGKRLLYTDNFHYLMYTFLFRQVRIMYFLNLGVKRWTNVWMNEWKKRATANYFFMGRFLEVRSLIPPTPFRNGRWKIQVPIWIRRLGLFGSHPSFRNWERAV